MLTSKQIKSLPKGTFSNAELGKHFNHGKQTREVTLPVDKNGIVITNLLAHATSGKPYRLRKMRLGRRMAKQYGKV